MIFATTYYVVTWLCLCGYMAMFMCGNIIYSFCRLDFLAQTLGVVWPNLHHPLIICWCHNPSTVTHLQLGTCNHTPQVTFVYTHISLYVSTLTHLHTHESVYIRVFTYTLTISVCICTHLLSVYVTTPIYVYTHVSLYIHEHCCIHMLTTKRRKQRCYLYKREIQNP